MRIVVASALVLPLAGAIGAWPATATPPVSGPSVLSAGERIDVDPASAQHTFLHSPNEEFQLGADITGVTGSSGQVRVFIQQWASTAVAEPWVHQGTGTMAGYLTLQDDGNLVLFASPGHPLWSSGTAGSGSNARLVLQDDGNAVLYSSTDHVLWASHSGRRVLGQGETLAPGQRLEDDYAHPKTATALTMQLGGELVLTHAGVVLWASNTDVPGSSLTLRNDGNLVIQKGTRTLWSSRTAGVVPGTTHRKAWVDFDEVYHAFIIDRDMGTAGGPASRPVYTSGADDGAAGRPGDAGLLTGQRRRHLLMRGSVLRPGEYLVSANGNRWTMRSSGNLVQTDPKGHIRWSTHTGGHRGATLRFGYNDLLVVRGGHGKVLWTGGSRYSGMIAVAIQNNGSVVGHDQFGRTRWNIHSTR